MNDLATGKEKLQKAFLEICHDYLDNLDLAPEEDISFSPRLERKMECLLKTQRKPYRNLIDTPLKKALAACLAILIFSGGMLSCKPIREPVVEFFTNVYEKFTEFFFDEEDQAAASKAITEIHTLAYIPEGYKLIESSEITDKTYEVKTVWEDCHGFKMMFFQCLLTSKTLIDTENAVIYTLENNTQITTIEKDSTIYVFWNDNQFAYTLVIDNTLESEILKIVQSITKKEI